MNRIIERGERYQSYQNLPAIAGLCSMPEAIRDALRVEEGVNRLKRFHYALKRMHEVLLKHITAEPIYELKMAFSYHGYLCAEHVTAIRTRVGEMRLPPLGLEKVPHPALGSLFDEILAAPREERLVALYQVVLPELRQAVERFREQAHPLADQPSRRMAKFLLLELEEMAAWAEKAVPCLVNETDLSEMRAWRESLEGLLAGAGGLDGAAPIPEGGATFQRRFSQEPYRYDPEPKRDERFTDVYNQGVNAEEYLYDARFDDASKVLMMFFKRIREIDVPEMMASIIAQIEDIEKKPWEYYREMTRQLWDEARHAMMGEIGFVSLGVDWTKIPVNLTWSLNLNTLLNPEERHAVLYFIEQGLMPKTGKRHEWETAVASRNPLAALFQDFDWADEVLHAQIGRRWYVDTFAEPTEAVAHGDECWSRVLRDFERPRRLGLTQHRNWWPELYREACAKAGVAPAPEALAYSSNYNGKRPDLTKVN